MLKTTHDSWMIWQRFRDYSALMPHHDAMITGSQVSVLTYLCSTSVPSPVRRTYRFNSKKRNWINRILDSDDEGTHHRACPPCKHAVPRTIEIYISLQLGQSGALPHSEGRVV